MVLYCVCSLDIVSSAVNPHSYLGAADSIFAQAFFDRQKRGGKSGVVYTFESKKETGSFRQATENAREYADIIHL